MRSAYFDDLVPGESWGEYTWVATQAFCEQWQKITGDDFSLYGDNAASREAFGGALAPPSLAYVFLSDCIQELMPDRPQGGVYARQKLTFLAPMLKNDALTTRMRVAEKYIKRERRFVRIETETFNQHGIKVLLGDRLSVWGG